MTTIPLTTRRFTPRNVARVAAALGLAWALAGTASAMEAPERSQADDGTVIYRVPIPNNEGTQPGPLVPGISPRSPEQVAQALGEANTAVLSEPVALRIRPQSATQPEGHVPAGTPVRSYRHVYNRDGHWRFIEVNGLRGWVPLGAVGQG